MEGCRLEPPRRGWASEVTTWAQRALCPLLLGCQAEVEPSAAGLSLLQAPPPTQQ